VAYFLSILNYKIWKRFSFWFLLLTTLLNLLLLIPGFGIQHGGATRWIDLGFASFQPAEFFKLAFIIYLAFWLSKISDKIQSIKFGILPFGILFAFAGGILAMQPDIDGFAVLAFTSLSLFFVAGAKTKHILFIVLISIIIFVILAGVHPYVKKRLEVFMNPNNDPLGASYQIRQSISAIGAGGLWGRGFGKSVQKFQVLPEPAGDSVYAVLSEEFGFIGSFSTILAFMFILWRGMIISNRAPDLFGRLIAIGIVILLTAQSFLNIASMLGLAPLSGLPLIFVSHGGTAIMAALIGIGIVLSVSRSSRVY
jgi:cell division protein FtsW